MKIKTINVIFVYVQDTERAKQFYCEKLEFGKPAIDTPFWVQWKFDKGSDFAICKARDERLEGCVPARSTIKFSMEVDDIQKAYTELFERGVRNLTDIYEGSGHLFVEFEDVDGNVLRIIEWLPQGGQS